MLENGRWIIAFNPLMIKRGMKRDEYEMPTTSTLKQRSMRKGRFKLEVLYWQIGRGSG